MEKLSIKQTRQISSYQAEVKVAIAGMPVDISKAINIGIKSNINMLLITQYLLEINLAIIYDE